MFALLLSLPAVQGQHDGVVQSGEAVVRGRVTFAAMAPDETVVMDVKVAVREVIFAVPRRVVMTNDGDAPGGGIAVGDTLGGFMSIAIGGFDGPGVNPPLDVGQQGLWFVFQDEFGTWELLRSSFNFYGAGWPTRQDIESDHAEVDVLVRAVAQVQAAAPADRPGQLMALVTGPHELTASWGD